jgi:hypothetical protein
VYEHFCTREREQGTIMDMTKLRKAEARLEAAVLAKEIPLTDRIWGIDCSAGEYCLSIPAGRRGACLLAVYLVGRKILTPGSSSPVEDAARYLGVPLEWVNGVEQGFTGLLPQEALGERPVYWDGYATGRRFRQKYLGAGAQAAQPLNVPF